MEAVDPVGAEPGARRYSDLRLTVVGISEKFLSQNLRELEFDGVVNREACRDTHPRVEYSLTPFGASLLRSLGPLCDWGSEHMTRIG
jgi:DNA-binding HxlR family transcriptional regulator